MAIGKGVRILFQRKAASDNAMGYPTRAAHADRLRIYIRPDTGTLYLCVWLAHSFLDVRRGCEHYRSADRVTLALVTQLWQRTRKPHADDQGNAELRMFDWRSEPTGHFS